MTLSDEFLKVKKEVDMYSMIYKTECESKQDVIRQLGVKEGQIERMVDMINKEKNKNKQHQIEITRLNEIIIEIGTNIHNNA